MLIDMANYSLRTVSLRMVREVQPEKNFQFGKQELLIWKFRPSFQRLCCHTSLRTSKAAFPFLYLSHNNFVILRALSQNHCQLQPRTNSVEGTWNCPNRSTLRVNADECAHCAANVHGSSRFKFIRNKISLGSLCISIRKVHKVVCEFTRRKFEAYQITGSRPVIADWKCMARTGMECGEPLSERI